MPKLPADGKAGLLVDNLLRRGQFSRARAAPPRGRPHRQFTVTGLRVLMAVSMHLVNASSCTFSLEQLELLHVSLVRRDEAAPAGESLCFVQHPALLLVSDGDLARTATLRPRILEQELIP